MKDIVSRVKELIEAAEPDTTVVEIGCSQSFACPVAKALWLEYLHRNPGGLTIPPTDSLNNRDPELLPYLSMWTVATIAKESDSVSIPLGLCSNCFLTFFSSSLSMHRTWRNL